MIMSCRPSKCSKAGLRAASALLIAGLVLARSNAARAQACCAGTGVVTPARLALHEAALAGVQLKAALEYGSFDQLGKYHALSHGASEQDYEQDLFASLRLSTHAQAAVLVPLIETHRRVPGITQTGGGFGDINLNARHDFTFAGASRMVPGIGLLAGLTLPSGTPPDSPNVGVLAAKATGIGAFQGNLALALEQTFGPWLLNLTGAVADRSSRTVTHAGASVHSQLAPQFTLLAAVAYVLDDGRALALSASYATEGDAKIDGTRVPDSGHRLTTLTLGGLWPLSDSVRLQAGSFWNPPINGTSLGEPALAGASATAIYAWL